MKADKPDVRAMRTKTLDELEGHVWGPPTYDSQQLVQTCHRLRTKPIGDFTTEDLRIMIGQSIGLPYLLPIAVERLEQNPWLAGDMYPGDLLKMAAKAAFSWRTRKDLAARMRAIIEKALADLPRFEQVDADGVPNLDVPSEELAEDIRLELTSALERV
jgi:hypothetical protein